MKILVADDDLLSRRLLEATLTAWGYDVVLACNGAAACAALQGDEAPRLAIVDWMMPGNENLEVCRAVRKRSQNPYIYMLLLTARDRKQDLVEGLEAGADDYLVKPVDLTELRARLRSGRRILDLQEQLLQAHDMLRDKAEHDPLTSLWNRGAILDFLDRELNRAHREQTPLGLLMADLDHFKEINDTHGHLAGDAILRQAAERMQSLMRRYDMIGRYGGEEFLIVLPGCGLADTLVVGERIRRRIEEDAMQLPGLALPVTVTVGAAAKPPAGACDLDTLLREADAALYSAKKAGRNRVAEAG